MSGSTLATTMQCCSVTEGMGIGNPTFRMHRAFHVELASFERSLTSGFAAFHRSGEKSSCLTAAGSIFLTTLFKYINIARSRSCCGALATRHIELALRPPPGEQAPYGQPIIAPYGIPFHRLDAVPLLGPFLLAATVLCDLAPSESPLTNPL
jgi:hypothetical protein